MVEIFSDPYKAGEGNVPGWSQVAKGVKHYENEDFSSLAGDVADIGYTGFTAWMDPLGALVSAGVGFLIDVIKPLHDMLTWVTGDDGAISDHRDEWDKVAKDLNGLADQMSTDLEHDLTDWLGPASEQGKARIAEFIQGTRDTANAIGDIKGLLALTAALCDTAMSTLKDLISQFVEWLIITWLAAQAAAIPTLGGSEAAAAAATEAEAAVATTRGARIVQKVVQVFKKLAAVVRRIITKIKAMRDTAVWRLTGKGGNRSLGPGGLGRDLVSDGRDARRALGGRNGATKPFEYDPKDPAVAAGTKLGSGLAQSGEDDNDNVPPPGEINRKLNLGA
ncbi:WXG100 family type VII secretion target [Actinomadura gamaensis]|uniref:WXG100 family type VII secretion target n=1 Tax=Actinomadura gamaensis TaxID=1763541 RepID=A0ABV9U5Y9_9ACTN